MIESPSNLTEQILNLVERIATEIRAIYNKLNTAVFKVNNIAPDSEGNVTISSVSSATKATQDGSGNVITSTYLTKTGKAASASVADKATSDGNGNNIASTYATVTQLDTKAPKSHASSATTYGTGSSSYYGHVKLSDATNSTSAATSGVAATPVAVKGAYDLANLANTAAASAQTTAENAQTTANAAVKKVNNTSPDASGNVNVDVTLTKDKVTSALGYTPLQTAPITSVNGNTGDITPEQTGCLPVSGGTMTGAISFDGVGYLQCVNSTSNGIQLYGANSFSEGAFLGIYGKDHASRAGWFYANAHDGTSSKTLIGKPDGTLTWGGENVLRSVNGASADANGNVTLTVGGSSAYQIPYGTCSTARNTGAKVATITNGASFSLGAGAIVAIKFTDYNYPAHITWSTLNVNSTGAKTVISYGASNSHDTSFSVYAGGSSVTNGGVIVFVYDGTYWRMVSTMARYSAE